MADAPASLRRARERRRAAAERPVSPDEPSTRLSRLSTRPVPTDTPRHDDGGSLIDADEGATVKTRLEQQADRGTPQVLRSLEKDWRERRRQRLAELAAKGAAVAAAPTQAARQPFTALIAPLTPTDRPAVPAYRAGDLDRPQGPHGSSSTEQKHPPPSSQQPATKAAPPSPLIPSKVIGISQIPAVGQQLRAQELPRGFAKPAKAPAAKHVVRLTRNPRPITFNLLPTGRRKLAHDVEILVERDISVDSSGTATAAKHTGSLSLRVGRETFLLPDNGEQLCILRRSASGAETVKRVVDLGARSSWSQADADTWHDIFMLVEKVKQRTERVSYTLPTAKLLVMANIPPDIVLYRSPPTLRSLQQAKAQPSAPLDRCLTLSLSRRILRLSLQTRRSNNASEAADYRSRRTVPLATPTDPAGCLFSLLEEQRRISSGGKGGQGSDGDTAWSSAEVRLLQGFLKVAHLWLPSVRHE